jgi:hypothetical protein
LLGTDEIVSEHAQYSSYIVWLRHQWVIFERERRRCNVHFGTMYPRD